MTTPPSMRRTAGSLLLAGVLLSACSEDRPENLLASARQYLAGKDGKAAVIQLRNALQANPNLPEGRFLLGKAFLETGDPVAAEMELRKALELQYSADQVLPLLARTVLAQGKPGKVLEEFAGADVGSAESRADLQTTLGMAHVQRGDIKDGEAALAKALQARSDYGPAMIGLARIRAGGGDYPGALLWADSAVEKTPGDPEAWKLKGDILSVQGAEDGALEAYRKALEANPHFVPAHAAAITTLIRQAKFEEAARQLDAFRKAAPKEPLVMYLDVLLAYQKGDFKAARELARPMLQAAPDNPNALELAGAVEFQTKSWARAEDSLAKALRIAPDLPLARRFLIATYLNNGQPGKALGALEPVLGKIGRDSHMLALAGQVYIQNGNVQKAEEYFGRAAALDPQDPGKRTSLAIARMVRGQVDSAFGELESIAATDSGTVADLALVTSRLRRHELKQALQALAALERKEPRNPLVHDLRGRTLFALDDLAGARASFQRAASLDGEYFPAIAGLAGLDMAEGKPDEARMRFEAVLKADPKSVQALLALADLRRQAGGSPAEVATLLAKAIAASPGTPGPRIALIEHYLRNRESGKAITVAQEGLAAMPDRPELLAALGSAQQSAGNYNQALASYGKLAAMNPGLPQPHLRMAEIHLAAGNKESARENLVKALELDPDQVEVRRGIAMIDVASGRTGAALAAARQLQGQKPRAALGYLLEGDIRAAGRNWPEAAAAYRASLKLGPASETAMKLHGVFLRQEGAGKAEAERLAGSWLKEHPADAGFLSYLAERATAAREYEVAARYFRALVELQPDNAAAFNNLAWVSGQLKDPQAIGYAERANRLSPNQPAVMDTLAMLLAGRGAGGDMERALGLLQRAVDQAPGQPEIRLNLARVLIRAGEKKAARKELEALSRLGDKFSGQAEIAKLLQEV